MGQLGDQLLNTKWENNTIIHVHETHDFDPSKLDTVVSSHKGRVNKLVQNKKRKHILIS